MFFLGEYIEISKNNKYIFLNKNNTIQFYPCDKPNVVTVVRLFRTVRNEKKQNLSYSSPGLATYIISSYVSNHLMAINVVCSKRARSLTPYSFVTWSEVLEFIWDINDLPSIFNKFTPLQSPSKKAPRIYKT